MSKITILEKIKNLTWYNLIEQLQDILPNFNRRIEILENKPKEVNSGGEGISEAPIDGNQYVRQDGDWTEINYDNFIKSNEDLSNAKRNLDIIYGILDQYTGEEITLNKIYYTPNLVDNIIYFQLGTEYFRRNCDNKFNIKWFGAKGDEITDDTESIQTCLNTLYDDGGGTAYVPLGIYIIAGALKNGIGINSIDYNSQIYIPTEGVNFSNRKSIEILGEVSPNLSQSAGIGLALAPNTGVIFRSTIQGSGIEPSVICGKGGGFFMSFSYTSFFAKNISIQVTTNTNKKITIGGFNFKDSAIANFEYVTVYPYNLNLVNSGRPDVINVTGIHMPSVNNEHINVLNKVTVGGFTNGYVLGEHTSAYDAIAVCCTNAFSHGSNFHIGYYGKISSFWCENDFTITASSYFQVNLQTEAIFKGKWYDNKFTVNDPSNNGKGIIHYNVVEEGIGVNNLLFKKNGAYFISNKAIAVNPIRLISGTSGNIRIGDNDLELIITNSNSPVTITIPNFSTLNIDVGTTIAIAQYGDGQINIVGQSPVTINTASTFSSRAKYSVIYLKKQYDDDWIVYGDLTPELKTIDFRIISGNTTLTATSIVNYHEFTGSSLFTWTLPVPTGYVGRKIALLHKGTANGTIVTNGGENVIYNGTLPQVNTYAFMQGVNVELISDGTSWVVL